MNNKYATWLKGKSTHLKLSAKAAGAYDSEYANENFSTKLYMDYELGVIDNAVKLIPFEEENIAIDLGSGTGRDTLHFCKSFHQVIGYDFSSSMIEVANKNKKKLGAKNVVFVQKDIDKCGLKELKDNSVSFVNAGFGMGSFIKDLDSLAKDVHRILKNKGVFTISFYNSDSLVNWAGNKLGWEPSLSVRLGHASDSLEVIFQGNKFHIATKAYSIKECASILSRYFKIVELSTFPTVSSLLPNNLLKKPKIRNILKQIDYAIRSDRRLTAGPYIIVVCQK
jgi:SAM-dependent methyltransferase